MSEQLTINELLALQKEVRGRMESLKSMRHTLSVATKNTTSNIYQREDREQRTVSEATPQYDVKALDKQIAKMERFLFRSDAKIKTANATIKIELDVDVDDLLAPLS